MSNEINGPKISVNQFNYSGIHQKQTNETPVGEDSSQEPQLKDFSDPKAESLGRTLLFKGADDINHDLKVLIDNPQIAENSDKSFEAFYQLAQDAGLDNPYEEAASFATTQNV